MSLKHYESISKDFEENWFFSNEYFLSLSGSIEKNIGLADGHSFGDLGCGTGNYTAEIVNKSGYNLKEVIGVDFSQHMVDQFNQRKINYIGRCSDLESFVASAEFKFDRVLLKEVIHHIKNSNIFYKNLKKILKPGGKFLIVTRPQKTNFPFFDAALKVFSENQDSKEAILRYLKNANFKTHVEEINIEISITKEKLIKMINNRFMSTFNFFNDEELAFGIKELELKYQDAEQITFLDDLIFIQGY